VGTAPAGQLSRELTDTTDGSMDQRPLTGLETAVIEQACQALSAGSGTAALSTSLSVAGFGARTAAGIEAYSAAIPSRSKGVNAYTSSPTAATSTSSATAYNHTGQLRRGNSGEPVERPLQLVAPDRGGVYLDKAPRGAGATACRSFRGGVDAGHVEPDRLHRPRNRHHRAQLSEWIGFERGKGYSGTGTVRL